MSAWRSAPYMLHVPQKLGLCWIVPLYAEMSEPQPNGSPSRMKAPMAFEEWRIAFLPAS
jgi:hypothetical protein